MENELKKKLDKDVDEFSSPSNRVLVRSLLYGTIALFIYLQTSTTARLGDCKEANKLLNGEIQIIKREKDSINNLRFQENNRLREMVQWQDSIKTKL